ncbi:MAG: SPOR domain-containing protein [Nitrosomonas sp.]|nr:SPOR domain-containing protein [Nitrosomonas sp.]
MNKNITEEELLLRKRARRRLVGAVVLVLTAVIILPMIFDEPKPDTETHEIDIHLFPKDAITDISPLIVPPDNVLKDTVPEYIDQMEFSTDSPVAYSDMPQPFEEEAQLIQGLDSARKKHIPIPGIKPRFERTQTTPAQTPPITQQPTGEVLPPPATVSIERQTPVQQAGTFVVQLGAFSDQGKAQQQKDTLISKGFNAFTETLEINGKVMTRVRIGPFSSRSAAQAELDKLRRIGQDGVITSQ